MIDTYGIIKVRHTGTARHFDVADLTSYTTQARFGGCACVSQPAQLVEAGFCVPSEDMMQLIKLSGAKDVFTIVDDEEYSELSRWTWAYHRNGYAYRATSSWGKSLKFFMHREIMNAPDGYDIDHINGNKLDNRKSNLRLCNRSQNMANTPSRGGTSQYKGVGWDRTRQKWQAKITVNYRTINLGRFDIEVDAARAYNDAALHYFGSFAAINKIRD